MTSVTARPEHTGSIMSGSLVVDMLSPNAPGHALLPGATGFDHCMELYAAAGVTWVSLTVALDHMTSIEATMKAIGLARRHILDRPDRYVFIDSVDDVSRAKRENRLGVNFNFQGTNPLAGDLGMVEIYRRLGVGHMLMAYNFKNFVGDGCHEPGDGGLSRYGMNLVQEMNRVGMIVDVSHTGHRTSMEVFEVSQAPVIFSHSNPRALHEHERNIRDDQIRACAAKDGVIGINGVGIFMSNSGDDVSAEMLIRQIDHVAALVGPRHIGFGLDFVEDTEALKGLVKADPARYAKDGGYLSETLHFSPPAVIGAVADGLLARGYGDTDVIGILGENFLRVCRQVWR